MPDRALKLPNLVLYILYTGSNLPETKNTFPKKSQPNRVFVQFNDITVSMINQVTSSATTWKYIYATFPFSVQNDSISFNSTISAMIKLTSQSFYHLSKMFEKIRKSAHCVSIETKSSQIINLTSIILYDHFIFHRKYLKIYTSRFRSIQ